MDRKELFSKLGDIERTDGFDLSKNTTYGLGGKCIAAFFPKTEEEAIRTFDALKCSGKKFFVLGNGSNILASDKFYDGYIISTNWLKGIFKTDGKFISCLSGTTVGELLNYCKSAGLTGLEFLAGIPASIGGLTCMNGGAGGKFMSDIIESVALYDGKLRNFSKNLCGFGYKHSTMRDINSVILSVMLKVERTSREDVEEKIAFYLNKRAGQPKGKSCGCVFKNPEGISAGKLIEECGLKGVNLGGASVSEIHANFIINCGNSALDVYNLIKLVKENVRIKKGILLDEEVVYIGDFNDTFG